MDAHFKVMPGDRGMVEIGDAGQPDTVQHPDAVSGIDVIEETAVAVQPTLQSPHTLLWRRGLARGIAPGESDLLGPDPTQQRVGTVRRLSYECCPPDGETSVSRTP
jgi:hypothetical protein